MAIRDQASLAARRPDISETQAFSELSGLSGAFNTVSGEYDRLIYVSQNIRSALDRFRKDGVAVAVLAGQHAAAVGIDREFPHLKFFGGDRFRAALRQRDLVEQLVGHSGLRRISCPR
jgi:hypothetical protein